jgi:hypothetical protein
MAAWAFSRPVIPALTGYDHDPRATDELLSRGKLKQDAANSQDRDHSSCDVARRFLT